MKLKTLKDLVVRRMGERVIIERDLKAEAIKWVKAFDLKMAWANERMKSSSSCMARVARLSPKPERDLTKHEEEMLEGIFENSFRVGLMRIHNITEEDLK